MEPGNEEVAEEITRLRLDWGGSIADPDTARLSAVLTPEQIDNLDRFDRVQLADVFTVCGQTNSISEAGRLLFAASRKRRKTVNDADRLRKYLAKFDLTFQQIQDAMG